LIRKVSLACVMLFVALIISGCAQMIADAIYKDKYAKPATVSRQINSSSGKAAVNAAVSAAGKTGWTPKTISVETGYVLAEAVADVKYTRGARDYTYRLEVRVPDSGKGDTNVVVSSPYTFFLLNDDIELNRYRETLIHKVI
jgi:hypothetical protein